MNINDELSNYSTAIVNAFNSYFLPVAENLHTKNLPSRKTNNNRDPLIYLKQKSNQCLSHIKLKTTSSSEIQKIINSLKCKNSYGYIEILSRILKPSAPYILYPLTYIFNKILSTGTFPDRPKFSEVKPIYKKKGDKTDFSNYGPISLLPSFSKIILKIIYRRLY
jgi:hypothetical protein